MAVDGWRRTSRTHLHTRKYCFALFQQSHALRLHAGPFLIVSVNHTIDRIDECILAHKIKFDYRPCHWRVYPISVKRSIRYTQI